MERKWVLYGLVNTRLPQKGPIFLEQTDQRTAAGSAVEPDGDFFFVVGVWVCGREEPEKQARLAGWGVFEETGVRLANVEWYLREVGAVDEEFYPK